LESRAWSSGIERITIDEIPTGTCPHVELSKAVELLERFELSSVVPLLISAVSGIPETWKCGLIESETVTSCRVQAARPGPPPPGQSQRAQRVLGASTKRLSECFRAGKRLERLERLKRLEQASLCGTAGTIGTGFS
jgi:hypothetical protein